MMSPMSTARRALPLVVCATLALSGLSGCGLLDGGSRLEEALEYLPAGSGYVTFTDRSTYAERVGIDDIEHGASENDLDRLLEETKDDVVGTDLARYAGPMQDAAFSELSVDWGASATLEGGRVYVWKMLEDVDLGKVGTDLVDAGYEVEEGDDVDRYWIDPSESDQFGLYADRYPQGLAVIAIVADEGLLVSALSARPVSEIVDVVRDDADSLSDSGEYADLLDHVEQDGAESATLAAGDSACRDLTERHRGIETLDLEPLGEPDAYAAVAGEEADQAVLLFDDESAAEADAEARPDYLDAWAETFAIEDVDFSVEADGSAVVIDVDGDGDRVLATATQTGDGPVACGSSD